MNNSLFREKSLISDISNDISNDVLQFVKATEWASVCSNGDVHFEQTLHFYNGQKGQMLRIKFNKIEKELHFKRKTVGFRYNDFYNEF